MRFTKPAWVMHQDGTKTENAKRLSIFSVHVHPDGSRIATGGLDAKVRVWSTRPILNQASEAANRPPKSLCTLTMHTGPVLTVRWAHSGRWLASGSDDEIVMIWDLDPQGAGRVWGSDEVNVEGWKPLKRLPGHESDVTDLAWSPEDRYLASTGLDSKVLIWCGYTLERLAKIDLHQGFVKGVCWDPVGEYLATQSDDRTVRIWRTTDWGLEATVSKPFEHSPGSTFFRRLSWSPDGAHITASNATNNNGFVFTAAVITRGSWQSDISLVGHENTVEVASYNPHMFLRNPSMPVVTSNICSVVALGADDRSVSVWQTKSARPLIVAKEVFERQIMDLSWSWDGLTLYAVSSDGTLAVFAFDPSELEGLASVEAQKSYLEKFQFVPPPLPAGYVHVATPTPATPATNGITHGQSTPPLTPPPGSRAQSQAASHNGFGHAHATEHVTTLVARRAPKDRDRRRVQPTFVGPSGSGMGVGSVRPPASSSVGYGFDGNRQPAGIPSAGMPSSDVHSMNNIRLPAPPLQNLARPSPSTSTSIGFGSGYSGFDGMDMDGDFGSGMDLEVPINAFGSATGSGRRAKSDSGSIAISYAEDGSVKIPKARTLGGDRVREPGRPEVRELRSAGPSTVVTGQYAGGDATNVLSVPSLKSFLEVKVEETGDVLEAKNSGDEIGLSEITFYTSKEKTVQWLDYLPAPALSICASSRFCAVAVEDGAVVVYSLTGRRIMPTLTLGSPPAFIDAAKNYLMVITASGQAHIWNTKTSSALHPPTSLLPLLTPTGPSLSHPNGITPVILSACIRSNGALLVQLSTGVALSYDASLLSWVRMSEKWWASGSACWKGRQRVSISGSNGQDSRGIVAGIESRISEQVGSTTSSSEAEKARPEWWSAALTLGHLETRMHAARVLESPYEYKQALLLYAKTVADEGFRGKAEELLKDLYGPVYWRPGKSDDSWSPSVLGMMKRDLSKEVLTIFARSKTLYKLAQDYQDLLRRSATDD